MSYDLSILIPARNEEFLNRTVEDILKNKRGKTEIIVGLDGYWPDPGVPQHEDVTVVHFPEALGQRACTNQLARISTAKYVMKCDAHCSFGESFDTIMMADMQDDWVMVPKMYNLHVFDWVCKNGHRRYQGPSGPCTVCGEETQKDILWRIKKKSETADCNSPEATSMRFDKNLKFQYWSGYKKQQHGDLVETMSLLGACWMVSREMYWNLNMCDEGHVGGWGQQGTEVACKAWLSGGKLICTKKTWFAHMFRTQGKDFGFPYPNTHIEEAREYSRDLWLNDKWDKAIHPLSWLIEKFNAPWDTTRGIIYYTDNRVHEAIGAEARRLIKEPELPIVSVSLQPIEDFGENIVLPVQRSALTMFFQILVALRTLKTDIVYFCEHDVFYHHTHFDFVPQKKDVYYYNTNVWKVRWKDGFCFRTGDCRQTSGLVAYRELLIQHYEKRMRLIEKNGFSRSMGFEPGTHNRPERVDDYKSESFESEYPNLDIRHGRNLTKSRWSPDEYRNKKYTEGWQESSIEQVPGWGLQKGCVNG